MYTKEEAINQLYINFPNGNKELMGLVLHSHSNGKFRFDKDVYLISEEVWQDIDKNLDKQEKCADDELMNAGVLNIQIGQDGPILIYVSF